MPDRRRAPRRRTRGLAARVRPGHLVLVLDVGPGGALLEGVRPLRPGAEVEVQFDLGTQRIRVGATVVRCSIAMLDPHRGPTYRSGIAFEAAFDWTREDTTQRGYGVPDPHDRRASRDHGSAK